MVNYSSKLYPNSTPMDLMISTLNITCHVSIMCKLIHQGRVINMTRHKAPLHMFEYVDTIGNEGIRLNHLGQGGIMTSLTSIKWEEGK
jgi:hypothetical protein